MTVSVNPQNTGRTVSGRGKALFVLIIAVIAAAFLTAGCGGKASAKVGQKPSAGFWSGGVDTDWYDEDEDEFVINTAEELAGLAELVNSGDESFEGKTVRLGRDIVINDTANWRGWASNPPAHSWTGIGTDKERFKGTFDGGGHTVSGVYIKNPEMDQGLFGVVGDGGEVKRLNVIASYIEGKDYVGILAGGTAGVISECHTSGIVVGDSIVGGLAGVNDGLIKNSYAAGSVKGRLNVGGLMGANRGGAAAGNYSTASVSGDSIAGGFVGANWGGVISGNYSTGKVAGSADIGGFAGRGYGGVMRNNYYDKETSGQSDSGKGEGKTTSQMQGAEFVDSLNVVAGISSINIWVRSDGGYPALGGKPADPVNIDGYFASGKGTGGDPYMISTGRQLEDFAWLVNLGARFSGKHLKLGQDIALNDTANWQKWAAEPPARVWMPVGSYAFPFDGTFDGGGHTVSGVYVNNMGIEGGIALFGFTSEDATIRNAGVTASYFRGNSAVGGLVAFNAGKIINCYSTAIVTAEEFSAGGLVGFNNGGIIIGCYATGAVFGGEMVGGLVGTSGEGKISNSYSVGAVSGGTAKVEDCDDCVGVGGLVGLNGSAIINCYTAGAVKGDGERVGPLVGISLPGMASKSYFDSEASGVEDNGIGSGRTTEQMKQKETFAGWDFNTVWIMDPAVNNGYPYLSGKPRKAAGMSEAIKENTGWYSAQATEFAISTAGELAAFAEIVNGTWGGTPERDDFAGKTVRLTQNIDLAAYGSWTPIGGAEIIGGDNGGVGDDDNDDDGDDNNSVFSGTFDGGGFVISNLTINRPGVPFHGLFGQIKNAAVKNLGLENVNIRGGWLVGAVAGDMTFSSSVSNCYSTGAVSGDDNVGGLAGFASVNCFIANSYSAASVSSHSDHVDAPMLNSVGGVVGHMQHYSMIINCYSTGAVSGVGNAGGITGGVIRGRSGVRGCAALNPKVKGVRDVDRVIASMEGINHGSLLSNNAAYAGMEISDGSDREGNKDFALEFRGPDKDGGADLTAHEVYLDPTLGGRFTKAGGWTTEKGKLPGLFGKAADMPPHLVVVGKIPAPKPAPKAKTAVKGTDSGKQVQESGRLKKLLSDLPEGATLTGSRTRASVQRVIMTEHRAALQQLCKWRREDKPELSGAVTVRFTIDESGKVTSAKLEKSTVSDAELENAVILRIRHTDFGQAGKPGGATEVTYPFSFVIPPAPSISGSGERRIPTTLEECYAALDRQLSEDVKDGIALSSRGDFLSSAHFGLGMWIRNNWIYPGGKLAKQFGKMHADSASSIILRGYYNYLNGIEGTDDDDDDDDDD